MIWSGMRGIKSIRDLIVDGQWGSIKDLCGDIQSDHHVGEDGMSNLLTFVCRFMIMLRFLCHIMKAGINGVTLILNLGG